MSLEDAITRLTRAFEQHQGDVAVREIIRERDTARVAADENKRRATTYEEYWRNEREAGARLQRKINALRGAITRMKKRRSQ